MIIDYNRPATLEKALELLARSEPVSLPLGGGSALDRTSRLPRAVVDLQALGLNKIKLMGNSLELGATTTLQALLDYSSQPEPNFLPAALVRAIQQEATYNLRQVATVAGTLVAGGGRSPFATAMLALDASVLLQPGDETVDLGNLLPLRGERLRGRLITQVTMPGKTTLAYEAIARTPADQPILCAAMAAWPSGRLRFVLGGFGSAPTMVFDGSEPSGVKMAARSACHRAYDEWASAEYRQEMAQVLAGRCLNVLGLKE